METSETEKIRWGTIIPLIGGSAVGCQQATGRLPDFHLSYSPFAGNEKHIQKYWPSVPFHYLDKEPNNLPNFENVDFINSVCPCSGLSMLNTASSGGKRRGADAAANKWMYESSVYILSKVRPKVLWGENAPGLFTTLGQGVIEKLKKIGEHFGYSFSVMKTSTDLHGIPQRRVRTFYFFWKSPTVPLMSYYSEERQNLTDYLNTIPEDATLKDVFLAEGRASERFRAYQYVLEKEGLTHAEFVKKLGKGTITTYLEEHNLIDECIDWLNTKYPGESFWTKTGKNRTHVQYLEHVKKKRELGLGYWDDSPRFFGDTFAAVMKKTMMWGVHPEQDRFLNAREYLHLMGLPHDFEIDGERSFNHIAQNVPTCTARDMALEVTKFIRGELPMTEFSFLKQDNTLQTTVHAEKGYISQIEDKDLLKDMNKNIKLLELLQQNTGNDVENGFVKKIIKTPKARNIRKKVSEEELEIKRIDYEIKMEKKKETEMLRKQKLEMKLNRKRRILLSPKLACPSSISSRQRKSPIDPSSVSEDLVAYMCQICKIFPRPDSINRSELYRHYSLKHFSQEIIRDHLQMLRPEPCVLCPQGKQCLVSRSRSVSHMGQSHLLVEKYLPEDWKIKDNKRRRVRASHTRPAVSAGVKKQDSDQTFVTAINVGKEQRGTDAEEDIVNKDDLIISSQPVSKDEVISIDDDLDLKEEDEEEGVVRETRTRSGRVSRAPRHFNEALAININKVEKSKRKSLKVQNAFIVEDENENTLKRKTRDFDVKGEIHEVEVSMRRTSSRPMTRNLRSMSR